MITTHKKKGIEIEFEKTDTPLMRRYVNAKIEEINCMIISMYNIPFEDEQ